MTFSECKPSLFSSCFPRVRSKVSLPCQLVVATSSHGCIMVVPLSPVVDFVVALMIRPINFSELSNAKQAFNEHTTVPI